MRCSELVKTERVSSSVASPLTSGMTSRLYRSESRSAECCSSDCSCDRSDSPSGPWRVPSQLLLRSCSMEIEASGGESLPASLAAVAPAAAAPAPFFASALHSVWPVRASSCCDELHWCASWKASVVRNFLVSSLTEPTRSLSMLLSSA